MILTGYQQDFLGKTITFPALNEEQEKDLAISLETGDIHLDYINYSVAISASRKFPFYSASNIDGKLFKKAPRKDNWQKDSRIQANQQWGPELYRADKSDFDKGHMTKREDVQWGDTIAIASKAASSTFFYTNAVPQHASLNQKIWRSLEDYILHTEAKENELKISVFTGPVLRENDPFFVTEVDGQQVQLPILFWKVVYYPKSDGNIYCAGFMMSQSSLLIDNEIIEETITEAATDEDLLFMQFKQADTYQVNIRTIEKLSGFTLPRALETYTDDRSIKLVLEEIDVAESLNESASEEQLLGFHIEGIVL